MKGIESGFPPAPSATPAWSVPAFAPPEMVDRKARFMSSNDTRRSPIGTAWVTESVFPLTRFLVPQPDEVAADLDGQRIETKKLSLGMILAPEDVGG
jgi:hypothetical protein